MRIPEQLWIPTLKDLRAQFAPVILNAREDQTLLSASISNVISGPDADELWVVTSIHAATYAGTAQNTTDLNIFIVDEIGASVFTVFDSTTGGYIQPLPATQSSISLQGEWYMARGDDFRVTATFDAAAANNRLFCNIHGVRIPRGNWQRG